MVLGIRSGRIAPQFSFKNRNPAKVKSTARTEFTIFDIPCDLYNRTDNVPRRRTPVLQTSLIHLSGQYLRINATWADISYIINILYLRNYSNV